MGGLDEETSHSWPTRQVTRTRHVPFQVQHACCQTALEDDDKVCSLEQTALRGRDNETTYRLVVHYVDKSSAPRATVPLDGPTCPVEGSLARLLAPVPRTEICRTGGQRHGVGQNPCAGTETFELVLESPL